MVKEVQGLQVVLFGGGMDDSSFFAMVHQGIGSFFKSLC